MSTVCVTILAVMAQIKNSSEAPFLHSSASDCDCIVNTTLLEIQSMSSTKVNGSGEEEEFFAIFYRISYIYYSMIGTMLTVFFGLIISFITDMHTKRQSDSHYASVPPKMMPDSGIHEGGFRTPGHFSVGSFLSLATQRRVSSFIHNVSQTTLKVENKLKEVISHSNLHHLHVPADDEERISILNEEDDDNVGGKHKRKMFYIGHQDDNREHDE